MKTLVAYFSHAGQNYVNGGVAELEHGNAEVLAGFAAQACGGDLFHSASSRTRRSTRRASRSRWPSSR